MTEGTHTAALFTRNSRTIALAAGAVLVVLLTPIGSTAPIPTGDNSWHAALAMGFQQDLQFGPQAIFTYGPLGFLEFPQLYFTATFLLAELYVTALHLLFFSALYWSLSRTFRWGWAVVLAVAGTWGVAAALLATPPGVSPASPGLIFVGGPVLIWCCAWIRGDLRAWTTEAMPFLLGAGSAAAFLVETNMAALVGALSLISVLLAEGRRLLHLMYYVLSAIVCFLILWVVTGQSLFNIGSYIHGSMQETLGYTPALSIENASVFQYDVAVLMVILVAWVLAIASPKRTLRLTWAPMILVAVYLFSTFKETFVIHGPGHEVIAFAACLVALLAIPIKASARLPLIATLVFAGTTLVVVNGLSPTLSALRHGMRTSLGIPATILSPGRRAAMMQTARTQIHEGYYPGLNLGADTVALARGKTTYIQNGQGGVSWAYPALRWQPLPVLLEQNAYTPYLDDLNADSVASDNGPQRILRPPTSASAFIGGVPAFQTPATVVATICHYDQLGGSPPWQVLGKVPNRCGSLHQISVVDSGIGRTVAVPRPTQSDEAIVATISSIPLPVTYGPLSFFYKPASVKIDVNGEASPNRFIAATAGQPHLMVEPEDLGYSCPFSFPPIRTFSITGGGASAGTTGLKVTFYAMREAPARGSVRCAKDS